jgi:hypothetical protein
MFSIAVKVSVGTAPVGDVAAAKNLLRASGCAYMIAPAMMLASVAKLAIVGVCALLSAS